MNILDKAYTGKFYVVAVVLSAIAAVLTSPQIVDLGWPWTGPIATGITALVFLIQQFTSIGDSSE